eukprot:TRINITY_DN16733_c0_g1::TRINITY_DN16733_c0_g1_i1::g.11246::m.11246 TRINITY_DN16733_c0_g1::TRINITY_DN16733_c0_g1_i1::g.11246  ORF type:complete len:296 (+),score=-19.96 TRINITY_DN16733_c0_g1_i1:60-890(+)
MNFRTYIEKVLNESEPLEITEQNATTLVSTTGPSSLTSLNSHDEHETDAIPFKFFLIPIVAGSVLCCCSLRDALRRLLIARDVRYGPCVSCLCCLGPNRTERLPPRPAAIIHPPLPVVIAHPPDDDVVIELVEMAPLTSIPSPSLDEPTKPTEITLEPVVSKSFNLSDSNSQHDDTTGRINLTQTTRTDLDSSLENTMQTTIPDSPTSLLAISNGSSHSPQPQPASLTVYSFCMYCGARTGGITKPYCPSCEMEREQRSVLLGELSNLSERPAETE